MAVQWLPNARFLTRDGSLKVEGQLGAKVEINVDEKPRVTGELNVVQKLPDGAAVDWSAARIETHLGLDEDETRQVFDLLKRPAQPTEDLRRALTRKR